MLTQGKSVVIGAKWAAELLRSRTEILARRAGGEPISQQVAEEVVYLAVMELLDLRQIWRPARMLDYRTLEDRCNTMWSQDYREISIPELTGDEEPVTVRDVFTCNILTQLVTEVEKYLLNPYFPDRSWDFLTVGRFPGGDLVIINEGDYRICRFEQMVREGKASY